MEARKALEELPSYGRMTIQYMEGDNFSLLICPQLNMSIFALNVQTSSYFRLSVYCNRRFCEIEVDFQDLDFSGFILALLTKSCLK